MKKICGYDVNGWRDTASRNWLTKPGDEAEVEGRFLIEGSILPSVVMVGEGKTTQWVGGAQAKIAPHGRGEGWGDVGRSDRRYSVLDCFYRDDVEEEARTAVFSELGRAAQFGVAAISDVPSTTEIVQECLLNGLRKSKISSRLLVWRPVLAALYSIENNFLEEGLTVGVICHTELGLSTQTLLIRKEMGQGNFVLAPERKNPGQVVETAWGYQGLFELAKNAVIGVDSNEQNRSIVHANAIGTLALGDDTTSEVIRKNNGDWQIIEPPEHLALPAFDLASSALKSLSYCDLILIETLCTGHIRSALEESVTKLFSQPTTLLPEAAITQAAFLAAQRNSHGDPIYFDFLPQISTIVQSSDGAANFDLIDEGTTLPAGELYRSRDPARFGIQVGQESFSVYLKKENAALPRKAIVNLGAKIKETVPIDMWVEQSPAAGRAKLYLRSKSLDQQYMVDWETAEEIDVDWDELIEEMGEQYPTIPNRLVLPCGLHAWEESTKFTGLYNLIDQNLDSNSPDWDLLSNQLSARPFGRYCISSDGELPANVDQLYVEHLEELTDLAVSEIEDRLAQRVKTDNNSLKFLTWQFRKCPSEIAEILIDTVQSEIDGRKHPFIYHPSNRVLVYQGLGRVASSAEIENSAIKLILDKPIENWSWRVETACLAFLLSRSDTAPMFLTREDVELISERVRHEFREELGSEYTKFNYAPFLLVGLLRWRMKEPRALVADHDEVATQLLNSVEATILDFKMRNRRTVKFNKKAARYLPILEDILSELQGEGTNPELLLDIYTNEQ